MLVWIFIQQAGAGDGYLASLCTFGAIPADITGGLRAGDVIQLGQDVACQVSGIGWWTVLTSMFMQGSSVHLIGNTWFMWVFGNNVEDSKLAYNGPTSP